MNKWNPEPLKVEPTEGLRFKVSGKILPIDRPTSNGNLYSREVCEKMVSDFNGMLCIGGFMEGSIFESDLSKVTHDVTKLWIEGDFVYAEFNTIQPKSGNPSWVLFEALSIVDFKCIANPAFIGYAKVNEDGFREVRDVKLTNIHLGYAVDIDEVCKKCKGMKVIGHSLSCDVCVNLGVKDE